MGLRCSVFGHDYADHDVERERADHGAEVVTTVRTTEACRRCGRSRVVSENTEIAAAAGTGDRPEATRGETGGDADRTGTDGRGTDGHERDPRNADGTTSGSGPESDETDFEFAAENGDTARGGDHRYDTDRGDDRVEGGDRVTESGSVGPTAAAATSRSLEDDELECPECGFGEAVLGSALRAGDSCPACGRGYLLWRTR
jgi:ribosomal protein L37E